MNTIDRITNFIILLLLLTALLFKDSIPERFQTVIPIFLIIVGGLSAFFCVMEYKESRKINRR